MSSAASSSTAPAAAAAAAASSSASVATAATAAINKPPRRVPRGEHCLRVFGDVKVDIVRPADLRERGRESASQAASAEYAQLQLILDRKIAAWKHLGANEPRHWSQLATLCAVSDMDQETVRAAEQKWVLYSRSPTYWYSTATAQHFHLVDLDSRLDLYRMLGDEVMLVKLFFDAFIQALPKRGFKRYFLAACFRLFTRLPFESSQKVYACMQMINQNGLSANITGAHEDKWANFVTHMERDFAHYTFIRKQFLRSVEKYPIGQQQTLHFESMDTHLHALHNDPDYSDVAWGYGADLNEDDLYDGGGEEGEEDDGEDNGEDEEDEDGGEDEEVEREFVGQFPEPTPAWDYSWSEKLEGRDAISHHMFRELSLLLKHDQDRYGTVHPTRLQREVLSSVVLATPNTVMVGSSYPMRLQRVMQYVDIDYLPMYFERIPELKQFSELILWALWQVLDWENTWYAGFTCTGVTTKAMVQWIGSSYKSLSWFQANAVASEERSAPSQRFHEYFKGQLVPFWKAQFGFRFASSGPVTFEDVINWTGHAAIYAAIKEDLHAQFPPDVITARYDIPPEMRGPDHVALKYAVRNFIRQALSAALPQLTGYPDYHNAHMMVCLVLEFMFLSQLMERTKHIVLDLGTIAALVEWQCRGTPKVFVLGYIIRRLRLNDITIEALGQERHRVQSSRRFILQTHACQPVMWLPDSVSTGNLKTFLKYAAHVKGPIHLVTTLMASKILTSLEQGLFKDMPQATETVEQARTRLKRPTGVIYPNEYLYTTPERRKGISRDTINHVLLPMIGLPVPRLTDRGLPQIVTPTMHMQMNSEVRSGINLRHSIGYFTQPHNPHLTRISFPTPRQPRTSEATVRRADEAIDRGEVDGGVSAAAPAAAAAAPAPTPTGASSSSASASAPKRSRH